jgi:hypothetical protein
MMTRFKGTFTSSERQRITQAARTVEQLRGSSDEEATWVVLNFQTPHGGYRYWGVRLGDGYVVYAHTAIGLAAALEGLRDRMIQLRSQALSEGSKRVASHY